MVKILTVFGATGNQGGSVIKAVLADDKLRNEFRIRAVTRDSSKPAARALSVRGVDVVQADMSSSAAAAPAVQGAHTVFLVTNFWESMSAETEKAQGRAVTDACKAAGVEHIIFSSLPNVSKMSEGKLTGVTHFDSKAWIEQYIRDSGIPATFVLAGLFMSNFFGFIRKADDEGNSYVLAWPEGVGIDSAPIPVLDAAGDTGKFVKPALSRFPDLVGRRILAASSYVTVSELLATFSDVMGKPAQARVLPAETWKSFLPAEGAQELLENMLLLEKPGYFGGEKLEESLALLDEKPTAWKAFVEGNREKWL
ncbi:NmrA-domain-containing protein [Ophiocordyceps camponoti-floridani]|uniref:NmrA-domain-containing protein n=1 Tax=Ophiocordyceps camponoti-floridani TaxID=2030778 RepID=A0A8H4QBF4_9HYPO|nr:NmrA-domain-containing protein [Ophiocordyceps camponoti-floridani]